MSNEVNKVSNFPELHTMTYGEIKELRKAGLDPATMDTDDFTNAKSSKCADWILEHIYKDNNFDTEPFDKVFKFAMDTYKKAFGKEDEIKN